MSSKERKALEDIKKCLVAWRCISCKHELYVPPISSCLPCPKCGTESFAHSLFCDDREGILLILEALKV